MLSNNKTKTENTHFFILLKKKLTDFTFLFLFYYDSLSTLLRVSYKLK